MFRVEFAEVAPIAGVYGHGDVRLGRDVKECVEQDLADRGRRYGRLRIPHTGLPLLLRGRRIRCPVHGNTDLEAKRALLQFAPQKRLPRLNRLVQCPNFAAGTSRKLLRDLRGRARALLE